MKREKQARAGQGAETAREPTQKDLRPSPELVARLQEGFTWAAQNPDRVARLRELARSLAEKPEAEQREIVQQIDQLLSPDRA